MTGESPWVLVWSGHRDQGALCWARLVSTSRPLCPLEECVFWWGHPMEGCLLTSSAGSTVTLHILSPRAQQNPQQQPLITEDFSNLEPPLGGGEEARMPLVMAILHIECGTIKRAEHRRIDAFELWCWRRLLRVPWTATRSNQSILKEIRLEYSLGGLMLKLKLQYFGHLM